MDFSCYMFNLILQSADKIWIVNLHGSANKKETAPDGSRDENIFDIMQGVSLFIGVKKTKMNTWAKVFYTDVWGTREAKLATLAKGELAFTELKMDNKMAYFIPFGDNSKAIYEEGVSIAELFPTNVTGIISGNDKTSIAPSRDELVRRMEIVRNAMDDKPILDMWGKFTKGQTAEKIRADVVMGDGVMTQIAFRPFDNRWTYYSGNSCAWVFRPREKSTMGHLLAEPTSPIGANIGLVFCKTSRSFFSPFVSKNIIAHRLFSAMCEITYIAPLYLRSEDEMFGESWNANVNEDAYRKLTQNLADKPDPLDVFDYVYGILHDPVYCEKYEQYLCRDFPRVPIINDKTAVSEDSFYVSEDLYREYVSIGNRLRKLHLLETKTPAELNLEPNTADSLTIDKVKYKNDVLQINADRTITGISQEVWEYQIGGHQVLDKWFKEHKGETLTIDKFSHIENVVCYGQAFL